MSHSIEYLSYMNSSRWQTVRSACLRRAGYVCQRCGVFGKPLQAHHLTYTRLGNERPEDLQALCPHCHEIADLERARESERRRYQARLNGWAAKKYGHDWNVWRDEDAVEEEFNSWLDKRAA